MSVCGPISIWRLSPETLKKFRELPPSRLEIARALLSAEERRKAAAFHSNDDCLLYIAAHAALHVILGRLLGYSTENIEFTGEGGAKPALLPTVSPSLRFNLTHTRGAVLIAVADGCEIGIDIEQHRAIEDLEALLPAIASPAERAAWEQLTPVLRQSAFYRIWTRKEAYLKAIGLGLFRDLQAITVPVIPGELLEPVLVDDRGESLPWRHWKLCDLPAWEGFSAALCWQSQDSASDSFPGFAIHDLALHDLAGDDLVGV